MPTAAVAASAATSMVWVAAAVRKLLPLALFFGASGSPCGDFEVSVNVLMIDTIMPRIGLQVRDLQSV